MSTYIALLRGINVSGQKIIKMADLKLLFEAQGFQNVQTYIQSGNVVFSSVEKNISKLESNISSSIKKKFDFNVAVMVITPAKIEYVLDKNPFVKMKKDIERLYVTFLSESPLKENIIKLNAIDFSPEEYFLDGRYIFLYVPNGYGKAKLNNNLFENKLKVSGTTRNWKTMSKLLEIIKQV